MKSLREPLFECGVVTGRVGNSHASQGKPQLARFVFDPLFQAGHNIYCTITLTKILSGKKTPAAFRIDHALT